MPIGLKNDIVGLGNAIINKQNFFAKERAKEMGSGEKVITDVVSKSLGNSLKDEATVLGKIFANMAYGNNALNIADNYLNSLAEISVEVLSIIAQAEGVSDTQIASLAKTMNDKVAQMDLLIKTAKFDGKGLLDGTLGSNELKNKIQNYSQRVVFQGVANANFDAVGAGNGVSQEEYITFGQNGVVTGAANNDTITVENETFTFKTILTGADNEVQIGATAAETAANFSLAFNANESTVLAGLRATTTNAAARVEITGLSNAVTFTAAYAASTATAAVAVATNTAAADGPINMKGTAALADLIGTAAPNVTLIAQTIAAGGDSASGNLVDQYNLGAITPAYRNSGAAADDDDAAAVYSMDLGGEKFYGAAYVRSGTAAHMNNYVMTFRSNSGKEFDLNFSAAFQGLRDNSTSGGTQAADAAIVATAINNLFTTNLLFKQTRRLDVNANADELTKGFSVNLTASSFANLRFDSFKIDEGTNLNTAKLTTTISGTDYVLDNIDPLTLVRGKELKLLNPADTTNTDILSFTIGDKDLTNILDDRANISGAIGKMLGIGSGIEVRVGLGADESFQVNIANLSKDKLFIDSNGQHISSLSLDDNAARGLAQEVLQNVKDILRQEQTNITTQQENIRKSGDALQGTINVTNEAASSYLDTDYVESSQGYSAALARILATISIIQAQKQIPQATQQLVQQL